MSPLDRITAHLDELVAIRRDLHAHPEIGFEETRTSAIVAERLEAWGIEVHRGVGRTGIVGVLTGRGTSSRRIGLRADMDALPIEEATNLPYRSTRPGTMHACGHDGHTAMLLGAAKYLSETRDFDGTAVFIFQPAEEGLGGARAMLADGLFAHFPCDEVYGLHNQPNGRHGQLSIRRGPAMAAADFFDIRIGGRGAHAAQPHRGVDPVVIQAALVQALQAVVSRNTDPVQSAVLSITRVQAGAAYNVIPEEAHLAGTIRTFDDRVRAMVASRLRETCAGLAAAFGAEIAVEIRDVFSVLRNSEAQTEAALAVARELFGPERVEDDPDPKMGSEDFADMLLAVPGAYAWLGAKAGAALHNAAYDFDDSIIPLGAAYLARLVERRAAAGL
ncbi:amidohydrolase [Methylobacterium sp. 4-46]|uniref:M20 aminoacylase family protein n=1 Tax=unclassified Methylobacterium TaxID=2615210 RepID=UPI000152D751|nr:MULTISPECIES: M20 aminoacylase family protein [Methylobacterium]ACA19003.1 amidohydrolase [Methylobacterium sp. 4-46]WFT83644.1 M20 family metallopeptidase [Methylobacterium nodulans]